MHDSQSTSWRPDAFARKWHALAERRRKHLAELHQSGAWERYFSEEMLRAHLREATREVEQWAAVLGETAAAAPQSQEAPATSNRAA
jgi:uncharacterized repeat protein (TIGR03809 family)